MASAAMAVLAVDPPGLGGVVLRAQAGPVRDAWLTAFKALLPAATPWRRMPPQIADERLLGGLDLTATLNAGHAVAARGLLSEADGGVLLLTMAERLGPGKAAWPGSWAIFTPDGWSSVTLWLGLCESTSRTVCIT